LRSNTTHDVTLVGLPINLAIQLVKFVPHWEQLNFVLDKVERKLVEAINVFNHSIAEYTRLIVITRRKLIFLLG